MKFLASSWESLFSRRHNGLHTTTTRELSILVALLGCGWSRSCRRVVGKFLVPTFRLVLALMLGSFETLILWKIERELPLPKYPVQQEQSVTNTQCRGALCHCARHKRQMPYGYGCSKFSPITRHPPTSIL